ncbi:rRNA maturation RNase YbeY [Chloroflexota bacterium]
MVAEIDLLVEGSYSDCPEEDWLCRVARGVLAADGLEEAVEMGLVITGQERVQGLNRIYRHRDEPTDVLSFFMSSGEEGSASFVSPPDGVRRLGEVIISFPQAALQAKRRRHSVRKELAILIVHGVLHLLGYDHEKLSEKRKMRARERAILGSLGVGEG